MSLIERGKTVDLSPSGMSLTSQVGNPDLTHIHDQWRDSKKTIRRFKVELPNLLPHVDPNFSGYQQAIKGMVEFDSDRGGLSENSLLSLSSVLRQWIAFCLSKSVYSFPITTNMFLAFIKYNDLSNKSISTLNQYKTQISTACKIMHLEDITKCKECTSIFKSLRKDRSELNNETYQEMQATPFRLEHLKQLDDVLNRPCNSMTEKRDYTFAVIAYATLIRSVEIRTLVRKQIIYDGNNVLIKRIKSKTDDNPEPKYITGQMACTVKKYIDFFDEQHRNHQGVDELYVFSRIHSGWKFNAVNKEMPRNTVTALYKRLHATLGLDGKPFSGHSPRIGALQDAYEMGKDLPELIKLGDWKSPLMVFKYLRNYDSKKAPNIDLQY